MKKLLLMAIICVAGYAANAQVMAAKPQWVTIKSENLRCWECKTRLENYLAKEKNGFLEGGVLKWQYNLLKAEIKFQFLPDRTSADNIRIALNNAGFDADEEKAVEEVYVKLPPACKRPADGGGPKEKQPCHLEPIK